MIVRLIHNLGPADARFVGLSLLTAREGQMHDLPEATAQHLIDRGWARLEPGPVVNLRADPVIDLQASEISNADESTPPKRKRGRPTNAERYGPSERI